MFLLAGSRYWKMRSSWIEADIHDADWNKSVIETFVSRKNQLLNEEIIAERTTTTKNLRTGWMMSKQYSDKQFQLAAAYVALLCV